MDTSNEEFWDQFFNLNRRLLSAIDQNKRSLWRKECETFYFKHFIQNLRIGLTRNVINTNEI
jgi:hypothetical protein